MAKKLKEVEDQKQELHKLLVVTELKDTLNAVRQTKVKDEDIANRLEGEDVIKLHAAMQKIRLLERAAHGDALKGIKTKHPTLLNNLNVDDFDQNIQNELKPEDKLLGEAGQALRDLTLSQALSRVLEPGENRKDVVKHIDVGLSKRTWHAHATPAVQTRVEAVLKTAGQ